MSPIRSTLQTPAWLVAESSDHSDPTGLYSYRNQPSRVLFALDKLVGALAPVIGYEALHGGAPISDGWHEGATKDKVEKWEEKTREVMKGWEDDFWEVERKTERAGWLKVGNGPSRPGIITST